MGRFYRYEDFSSCRDVSRTIRALARFGPYPLFETHIGATLARAIMAGVELEFFESLEVEALTVEEIAKRCDTEKSATTLLLDSLVACRYLALTGGRYSLVPMSRKWLLRSGQSSVRDKILLQAIEWRWLTHMEDFVRTGRPLNFHAFAHQDS